MIRILVVEDEADVREDIVGILEMEGFQVEEAFDGLDGLEKAPDFKPDMIISDVSMPRLNGHEFFKKFHEEYPDISDVPFLFLTAYADRDNELIARELGASDYLTKPVDFELLIATIKSQLVTAEKANRHLNRRLEALLDHNALDTGLLTQGKDTATFEDLLHRYQSALDGLTKPGNTIHQVRSAVLEFRTPTEAKDIAFTLARVCPSPEGAALGFTELLVNAVEHGNLALDYADKSRLLKENAWTAEIERRLASGPYADRIVRIAFERSDSQIKVHIEDQGDGFDFKNFLEIDPARMDDLHGRGIAFAKSISFSSLRYEGKGNKVTAVIDIPPTEPKK